MTFFFRLIQFGMWAHHGGMSGWKNSTILTLVLHSHELIAMLTYNIHSLCHSKHIDSLISFNRCLFWLLCCSGKAWKNFIIICSGGRGVSRLNVEINECSCFLCIENLFNISFCSAMTGGKNFARKIWNDNIFFYHFLFSIVPHDHFTHFHSVERRRRLSRRQVEHFCVWISPPAPDIVSGDISREYWRFFNIT